MTKLTYILLAILLFGIAEPVSSQIQRVRIDFQTPLGYTRHLLLGFTPDNAATDGVDYGYDAPPFQNIPDDMNWSIDGQRYVIQGVGEFNVSKSYPLGIFLSNSGDIAISLNSLENFETNIGVFVYDALLGTFTELNSQHYANTLTTGNYLDRFYITFTDNITQLKLPSTNALSVHETYFENTSIKYLQKSNELLVDTKNEFVIKEVSIYNLNAQEIYNMAINSEKIKLPLDFIHSNMLIVKLTSDSGAQHIKQIVVR